MRVLVCGGRSFSDTAFVHKTLDDLNAARGPITCVIHGAMTGADTEGKNWAVARGIEQQPFPAEWRKYGRAAGPIRNQQMITAGKPDLVVAFPGRNGTQNMVRIAQTMRVEVIQP